MATTDRDKRYRARCRGVNVPLLERGRPSKKDTIEQAIARGWSLERILVELDVTETDYARVVAAMERACRS